MQYVVVLKNNQTKINNKQWTQNRNECTAMTYTNVDPAEYLGIYGINILIYAESNPSIKTAGFTENDVVD